MSLGYRQAKSHTVVEDTLALAQQTPNRLQVGREEVC